MCGRFTLRTPQNLLAQQFLFDPGPDLAVRFNIAPTQKAATVRQRDPAAGRELAMLRWGLIPSWAKDSSIGARTINARGDTVAEKPSFRSAFKRRRCLVLADGFFEWEKEGKPKPAWYIRLKSDRPFAMAGLWESWVNPEEKAVEP